MFSVDDIILQHATRGMDKLRRNYKSEYCKIASEHFLALKKGVIFLYTGFYVQGHAETDGPLGTYFLAKALKALGFEPVIVTDDYCKDFFKGFKTLYLGHDECEEFYLLRLLKKYQPVCHIAIERCGKNAQNKYMNARGDDISSYTPALDMLFELGDTFAPTFAIADGGNEIGMGNVREFIKHDLHVEPSVIKCDFLIVASVSNWGTYGFLTYLEKHFQQRLLPSFEEVDSYLEYLVSLGCVDGLKMANTKSVDGKEWFLEKQILTQLRACI